ncbi:MAG: SDR family oxidoreductase [Caldilineaceae bacterium]
MNVTIFGSTGGTGKELVKQALATGYDVTVYVRNPDRLSVTNDRLKVIQGNLDEPDKIEEAIAGTDVVLSALGPTSNKPGKPVTKGMGHIVAAMEKQNVARLIVATGAGVADPNDKPQLIGQLFGLALRLFARHVLADSQAMVAIVRNSNLKWIVVRAPRLIDKSGTGQTKVGYAGQGPGTQLSRADFARFMLEQINDDTWLHKAPMLSN